MCWLILNCHPHPHLFLQVFIVQTLSVATLQAVWVILEVKLDRWEESALEVEPGARHCSCRLAPRAAQSSSHC